MLTYGRAWLSVLSRSCLARRRRERREFRRGARRRSPAQLSQILVSQSLEQRLVLSSIALGQIVDTQISPAGDIDTYEFALPGRTLLYIDSLIASPNNTTWTLHGPAGVVASGNSFSDPVIDTLVGGAFSLQVRGDAETPYSLRILSLEDATPVAPGSPVSETLSPASGSHLYRFDATAGQRFYFDSSTAVPQNANWRLLDPLGQDLTGWRWLSGDGAIDALPLTGTYTLLVEGAIDDVGSTDYEFNISLMTPVTTPLTLGSTVNGSIDEVGERDLYSFSLAGPGYLYFDGLSPDYWDYSWQVSGPTGTVISGNAGDGHVFFAPIAGNYTVAIDKGGDGTGAYAFRLLDLSAATPLTPGTPVAGTLDPANETDVYQFQATAGQRFFFDSNTLAPQSANWRLLDPLGVDVTGSQWLASDGEIDALTLTGTYTLLVEGAFFDVGTTDYEFNVTLTTPVVTPLTLGSTVNGSIDVAGERDRYTFALAGPTDLYFDGQVEDYAAFQWQVSGPAGSIVNGQSGDGHVFRAPIAGEYTLTIDRAGDGTGGYAFRLLDLSAAAVVTPGTPVNGTLNPANETDVYRFDATAGDQFFFNSSTPAPQNAAWRLINPLGQDITGGLGLGNDLLLGDLPLTGTYALLVEGPYFDTGTTNYSFNLQFLGNNPPAGLPGTPITLGSAVNETFADPGETDQYTFEVTGPTFLYLDGLSSSYAAYSWTVTGPSGVVGSHWAGENFPFFAPIAGTYQVSLTESEGGSAVAYSFRVLDLSAATPLTPGTPVAGTLDPANSTHAYRFEATAGERFFFDSSADTPQSATWRLLNPLGQEITWGGLGNDGELDALPLTGTYTLLVAGPYYDAGATNYSFSIQLTQPVVTPLTLGATVNGSIDEVGERDLYTFTLGGPAFLHFDGLAPDYWEFAWQVSGPAGHITSGNAGDPFTFHAPIAGEYTLTIDKGGDGTGAYSFRLLDLSDATPLTPGTPVTGTLDPANETDIYQFEATAGQRFFFDSNTAVPQNANWRLLDPLGNDLTGWWWLSADGEIDALPLTGTYTLLVEGAHGDAGTTDYEFNVTVTTPVVAPLTLGSTVNGSIDVVGERDLYTFTLNGPAFLHFDGLSPDYWEFAWQVSGPAGHVTSGNAGDPITFLAPIAGEYTLTIDKGGDGTGAYSFRLLDLSAATLFTPGTPVAGTLDPANSTQAYRFEAAAGERFFFDSHTAVPQNANWRLLDPLGQDLTGWWWLSADHEIDALPLTGTYTLLVEGAHGDAGTTDYEFNVTLTTPVVTPLALGSTVNGSIDVAGERDVYTFTIAGPGYFYFDGLTEDYWAFEWQASGPAGHITGGNAGDGVAFHAPIAGEYTVTINRAGDQTGAYSFRVLDLSAASVLTPGTPVNGTLNPANETDVYQFDATAGDQFFFNSSTPLPQSASWRLINPLGQDVTGWLALGSDMVLGDLALTGTYVLLVEGAHFDTGTTNYSFNLQFLGNNPPAAPPGTPIALGNTVNGTFENPGEVDQYTFDVAGPAFLYFDGLTSSLTTFHWTVTGPNGAIASQWAGDNQPFFVPLAGTYQVSLTESEGGTAVPYSFRVLNLADAAVMTPGTSVVGTLDPANETVAYRFEATAGQQFFLDSSTEVPQNATWRLFDPLGRDFHGGTSLGADRDLGALALPGTYTLLVEGAYFDGGTTDYEFVLNAINPNLGPTQILLSNASLDENEPAGTVVGLLDSPNGDEGDLYTYTLVSGAGDADNGSFTIVDNELRSAESFNFEAQNEYSVRIRVTYAGQLWVEDAFTISVNDINEAPTDIALSANSVPENEPAGTVVGELSSTDEDAAQTFTYTLVAGDGSADNGSFQIVGDELRTAASFNFEAKNSYTVRVRTTDQGGLFFEEAFTINVTDVNEAPTDIALSANSVPENEPAGTVVGELSSTDEDAAQTFTYTLVAGDGSADNGSFQIVGDELRTAASFNFEAKNSYTVRVRTTDQGGLFFEEAFTINVTDVNEAPTDIALSANSVPENEPAGTVVGELSSTDEDAAQTFTYALVAGDGSADNGSFQIVGDELRTAASFNFEAKSSYTVRVRTTDQGGLFTEQAFTINVTNVNEQPTDIALSANGVAENQPVGTPVGNFSTTDVDAGNTFTYTLVAGDGSADNGSFQIVGNELRTAAGFDFETKSSYTVRVRSTDQGGLFAEKAFSVSVTDANDAPTDIALSANAISENAPVGTPIGNLSTTDVDVGDTFTYTLVGGTGSEGNASFAIVGGQLRSAAAFDFDLQNSYSIRVRSTDAGGLFFEEIFAISIVQNQNPVVGAFGAGTPFAPNTQVLVSPSATFTDADSANLSGGQLIFSITANKQTGDVLYVKSAGAVTVTGGKISFNGVEVATIVGGGVAPLTISFNAASTPAAAQAILRNAFFQTNAISALPRTLQLTATDGDGGSVTLGKSLNENPVVVYGGTQAYAPNTQALLSPDGTFSDVDSANLDGGQLIFSITANKQTGDVLYVKSAGAVTVTGGKISFHGVEVATIVGGGVAPLTISFNAASSPAAAQAILRNAFFQTSSGVLVDRTVQLTATDGDGGTAVASKSIAPSANQNPAIGAFGTSASFTPNVQTLLAPVATFTDADSANLDGGQLIFSITANKQTGDVLYVKSAGAVTVTGGKISFNGVEVATIVGGGVAPLTISFNAASTPAAAQAILRNAFFQTSSGVLVDRTVQLTATDGDGGSVIVSKTLTANQNPAIGDFGTSTPFAPNTQTVFAPLATFADADSANLDTGKFTFTLTGNKQAGDLLYVKSEGAVTVAAGKISFNGVEVATIAGGVTAPLTVTFNAASTPAAAQAILRNAFFQTSSGSTLDRTLQLVATDGDGGSATVNKSLVFQV